MSHTIALVDGEVDIASRRVRREKVVLSLTPKEAELLEYLTARPGKVVPREELLTAVWHYKSGVVSRTVDATVRRLREKIEEDQNQPVQLITVHGEGYRWNPLDVGGESPISTGLVGRKGDLARLARTVRPGHAVTVVGPGGVGKTAILRALIPAAPEAVFVDLTGVFDLGHALERIEAGLKLVPGPEGRRSGRIKRALQAREIVWCILDCVEEVSELGAVLTDWCAQCPRVAFVLGSRRLLEFEGEVAFELPPLGARDGAELLAKRLRQLDPDVEPVPIETLLPLVRLAHGLPLGLQWLAADLQVSDPRTLLQRHGEGDVDQATLERLNQVWKWLSAEEQRLLSRLSVFPDSAAWDAVEGVVGEVKPEYLRRWHAAGLIGRESADPVRYRLPDRVRGFAWSRLSEDEKRTINGDFNRWYADKALEWAPLPWGCTAIASVLRLAAERSNLRRVIAHGKPEEAWAAWWAVAMTWPDAEPPTSPAVPWPTDGDLKAVCESVGFEHGGPEPENGSVRLDVERLRRVARSDLATSEAISETLLLTCADDRVGRYWIHLALGSAQSVAWKPAFALRSFRRAESELCAGDDRLELDLRRGEGSHLFRFGDIVGSMRAYERFVELAGILQDPVTRAASWVGLGNVAAVLRQSERSIQLLKDAVRDLRRYDFGPGRANRIANAAISARELGYSHHALEWFGECEEGMTAYGDRYRARYLSNVARVWLDLGEYHRAEQGYREAYVRLPGVEGAMSAAQLGLLYQLQGRAEAAEWYAIAERELPQLMPEDQAMVLARLGAFGATSDAGPLPETLSEDVRLAVELYRSVRDPTLRIAALTRARARPPAVDHPMVSFAEAFTEVRFAMKVLEVSGLT